MCVQQRFGDAARKETDNDIPDEMKHILPFESCDLEDGTQIIKLPVGSDAKI